jgi:uncharacterized protein YsxB (DUF464 family)
MITINAVVDQEGVLRSCAITGHGGAGPKGSDIVCASVSILARTAGIVLTNKTGIRVWENVPKRGVLGMEIEYTEAGKGFLSAAGTFLLEGLQSIAQDYPDQCTMHIYTERRN